MKQTELYSPYVTFELGELNYNVTVHVFMGKHKSLLKVVVHTCDITYQ